MSFVGLGSEVIAICPTLDNASAGSGGILNLGTGSPTITFENGMGAGHWLADTGAGGSRCLTFGSDRGVHLASSTHGIASYPWWLSMWIYATSITAFNDFAFFWQVVPATSTRGFCIKTVSGVNRAEFYNGVMNVLTGAVLNLNAWNHFVFCAMNSGAWQAWLNGVLAGSGTSAWVPAAGSPLTIGRRTDSSGDCWNGRIDDTRCGLASISPRDVAWLNHNRAIQGEAGWNPQRQAGLN